MYLYIIIRHNILIQSLGNYTEVNKFNFLLEIEILRLAILPKAGTNEGNYHYMLITNKS